MEKNDTKMSLFFYSVLLFSVKLNIVAIKHIYIFMLNDYLGENKTYLNCKNHLK